jgi:hypothetical protein
MTDRDGSTPAESLVNHLKKCRKTGGALVGDAGVDMTPVVAEMIAAGWRYEGTEYIDGKRVRYLAPPPKETERESNDDQR